MGAASRGKLLFQFWIYLRVCTALGWVFDRKKCQLWPAKTAKFLGFVLNTEAVCLGRLLH